MKRKPTLLGAEPESTSLTAKRHAHAIRNLAQAETDLARAFNRWNKYRLIVARYDKRADSQLTATLQKLPVKALTPPGHKFKAHPVACACDECEAFLKLAQE